MTEACFEHTRHNGEVADLVDDAERWTAEEAQALAKAPFAFGLSKARDEVGEGAEVDALSRFDGLAALDEAKLGKCQDAVTRFSLSNTGVKRP